MGAKYAIFAIPPDQTLRPVLFSSKYLSHFASFDAGRNAKIGSIKYARACDAPGYIALSPVSVPKPIGVPNNGVDKLRISGYTLKIFHIGPLWKKVVSKAGNPGNESIYEWLTKPMPNTFPFE